MKKISLLLFSLLLLLTTNAFVLAETVVSAVVQTPIQWISKTSSDVITINNGNSNDLTITINVNKPPVIIVNNNVINNNQGNIPPGINIKNCGDTKHIEAGSSAICSTNDASNPISFSTDSQTPVTGTYIIKQNK
jgi:hypothetical protein